jgi:two-component system cell cycle sensor histidine kinase/response regulator CckA
VKDHGGYIDVESEIEHGTTFSIFLPSSGKKVHKTVNKDRVDLVILDMIMPEIGGGEAYDKMKEINPEVKVSLSSGYSIDGKAPDILKRGCNGFIQKPFSMKELSEKITEVIKI